MSAQDELAARALRILLVEDNSDDAFLLERHFRRAGFAPLVHRIETEAQMREALAAPERGWHVVLADYNLPQFSGLAALAVLQSTGLDIPFIVLSGAVSEDIAVDAMRAGAQDYVSKQNLARLVPAIERELSEAETRQRRRATESALRASELRFHRLVEAMPLGLLISDRGGRLLYANQSFLRLLGYGPEEAARGSMELGRLLDGIDPERFWKLCLRELTEIDFRSAAGEAIPLLAGGALLNPDAPAGERQMAAFLADMREQKRSHEVLRRTEKLAAAGRLAASIAHEINNPLEAVTNCLYLLRRTSLDSDGGRYLDMAQRELDRVAQITTQTLRFYRQNTRPVETDIHELFDTVLALYEARLRTFNIEVRRCFGRLPLLTAYDGEIRQVLANLIGNAVDAMQSRGGMLLLRTRVGQDAGGRKGVVVTVSDSGCGMDRATVARIYEPFFSTKGITGTGLGLWVSREILEKHGAVIRVRSRQQAPSGTVFRIFFPEHLPPAPAAEPPPAAAR